MILTSIDMPMTDASIMPFGMHKGKRLDAVPDNYLLWLYENGKAYGGLKEYIAENIESIKFNIENERKKNN